MKIPLCTFIRNTVRTDSMIEIPLCTFIQDCTIIRDTRVGFERGDLCFSFCIQPEEIASSASIIQLHSIVASLTKETKRGRGGELQK